MEIGKQLEYSLYVYPRKIINIGAYYLEERPCNKILTQDRSHSIIKRVLIIEECSLNISRSNMEVIGIFGILIISCFFLIWLWLKNRFNYWSSRNIANPPCSYIWGNMKSVLLQQCSFADITLKHYEVFKSAGKKYGGIFMLWSPVFYPIDLEIIKSIMQVDFQHFVDRGVYFNEKADPLSAHLFAIEGKKWKLLRNKLSPTFTSGKMKMMYETVVDCTVGLFRVMDKEIGNSVDIKDILGRFTTDIIGSCAFGLDINSLENPDSEFREKGKSVFHRGLLENLKQFLLFSMPNLMKNFNLKATPNDVTDFFMNVVKNNVAYREKNNIFRKDFMHLLIQLKNKGKLVDDDKLDSENLTEDENTITMEEIAAQAFIFFEAGFETSSTTMTFCLYELAKNKTIQDRLRGEIQKVLKKHDGKLTYDTLMNMHYLEQVINETLRKYPPVPMLVRVCTKDYKIPDSDVILEKGTKVTIPLYGIQRDPDYYPDPDKFDPERFSEENKNSRPAFSFIPFGEGPRVCIGTRFGMMQTKVGLVALMLNYEITVSKKTREPLQYDPQSFVTSTKGGIWLDLKKISPNTVELLPQSS
ncbi:hypothetical protein HHI36_017681 [Cryptolaemus montrouzieri]|uniref:Cytochrome P450 n=1 Tax=Cryptolaemus montrouzieri TaxID=559131 RepID=A0ABD2NP94_9CUCU